MQEGTDFGVVGRTEAVLDTHTYDLVIRADPLNASAVPASSQHTAENGLDQRWTARVASNVLSVKWLGFGDDQG